MLQLLLHSLFFLTSIPATSAIHPNVAFLGSFANGSSVYGIADLYGMLHVIRSEMSELTVYAGVRNNFMQLQAIAKMNQTGYYDMVRLMKANMLVLLNWNHPRNVTIMHMYPPYKVESWRFTDEDTVAALSYTEGDERIIITESKSKCVKVFTKEGRMLRQIFFKSALSPRQTIRTLDNLYAVTFGYERTEPHYICRFNVLGYVVGVCFGGRPGNSITQLDVPARLLNAKNGDLLVADMANKRILKVSRDMTSAVKIAGMEDGIQQPYRLEYGNEGVLYVADNVLDPVTKFSIFGRIIAFNVSHVIGE